MPDFHLTIDGAQVRSAWLRAGRTDPWLCDVDVSDTVARSGKVSIGIGDAILSGTIIEGGIFGAASKWRVVGGAGGWSKIVPARHYHNDAGIRVGTILDGLAATTGETIDATGFDTSVRVGFDYVQVPRIAGTQLTDLAPAWYVDRAGKTRLVARADAEIATDYIIIDSDGRRLFTELTINDPTLFDIGSIIRGTLVDPVRVRGYEMRLDARGARVHAWGAKLDDP